MNDEASKLAQTNAPAPGKRARFIPDGKSQLKTNPFVALDRNVPEFSVREAYFTEFLVRR